jgi:hypothetical protein
MTTNRMASLLGLLSPAWAGAFLRWQRDRERARQKLERLRTAETAPPIEPEPRERHVNDVFLRMTQHRRGPWRQYADELAAERRRMTITNHRGMHVHR